MAPISGKRDFELMICKAIGIQPYRTTRIIIDLDACKPGPIPIYVEMLGDEKLLEIDWDAGLGEHKIIRGPRGE